MRTDCSLCSGEAWVCEQHPDRGWPHDECAGPGMPCPDCKHRRAERTFATSDPSVYTSDQHAEPCFGGDSPTGTARPQPGREPFQQPR